MKRKPGRILFTLMGMAAGAILLVSVVILFACRISQVKIEGNQRVSTEEVEKMIHLDEARGNSFLLLCLNRKASYKDQIMVRDIKISLDTPANVIVHVDEELPVACVQEKGQYSYVNSEGTVLFKEKKETKGIPVVSGITAVVPEEGEKVETGEEELFADLLDTARILQENDVKVSGLKVSKDGSCSASSGQVTIRLGQMEHMKEKAQEISNLKDHLTTLSGTLYLDKYDSSSQMIVFSQEEKSADSDKTDDPKKTGQSGSEDQESSQESACEEEHGDSDSYEEGQDDSSDQDASYEEEEGDSDSYEEGQDTSSENQDASYEKEADDADGQASDGSYEDSSYDDGSYDDGSYDDGSYDDGSYDDGSYEDSSYDDGSYDDGSYDDGTYEEGYDEGYSEESY